MSAPTDGGPAFPTQHPALDPRASGFHTEGGMTLRDWFAGQALAGFCATGETDTPDQYASVSYLMADAMLAARQRRGGGA